MKDVNENALEIMQGAAVMTCDVYIIKIGNNTYTYQAYDGSGKRNMVFKHDQIKTSGEPTVDTLNITVYCDANDKIGNVPFMQLCHNGGLENATLELRRAYFASDGSAVYQVPLFKGRIEVASSGGLAVKLRIKSYGQGLAAPVPPRIFARQNAYAMINGVVTTLASDTNNMVIPLKPSGNVLVSSGG